MKTKVSIIILNLNGWKDTIDCLESLYQITYPYYNVILVDNGSKDNSIKKIRKYCEGNHLVTSKFYKYSSENKPIRIIEYTRNEAEIERGKVKEINELPSNKKLILIKNEKNYGFAEGNNIGIKYALNVLNSDYVLVLNNDTIVDRDFLGELVKVAETDETIGSVQALLLRPGGKIIDSLGQELLAWTSRDKGFNTEYKRALEKDFEIFGSCAAAAVYKNHVLRKVGLFDKDFFIYLEDIDLSWRVRLSGFKSFLVHKSVVYHKRGLSAPPHLRKKYHSSKNWLIILLRYYPFSLRFFRILSKSIYYASRIGKIHELSKILVKNLKMRKIIKQNPFLKKLQLRWIKRYAHLDN
ncbi:MAG: glycosyltransferase family 2 protein [Promethearchaeota archaeon]